MTVITITSVQKDSPAKGQVTMVGTYTEDVSLSQFSQQMTVLEYPSGNTTFARAHRLTDEVWNCFRYGVTNVGIYISSLAKVAAAVVNGLTFAPNITTQPASVTTTGTASATGTLTSDNTIVADGATVTIGSKVYTFKTTLGTTEGNVHIGASADASLDNLIAAINHTGTAFPGNADYYCAAVHPTVTAAARSGHTFTVTAITSGYGGNAIVTPTPGTHLSWGSTTLTGGTSGPANFLPVVNSEITAGYAWQESADGVTYGSILTTTGIYDVGAVATGTLTSDATAPSNNDIVIIGNRTYTFKTALTVPAVADEVLIGVSAAVALDNIKSAINATAGAGTTYSTGTTAHAFVTATTNTNTTQLVEAIAPGTGANGHVTLETSSHLAWGAATLTGGTDSAAGAGGLRVTPTNTSKTGYFYRCTITNGAGSTVSEAAQMTVT